MKIATLALLFLKCFVTFVMTLHLALCVITIIGAVSMSGKFIIKTVTGSSSIMLALTTRSFTAPVSSYLGLPVQPL